MDVRDAVETHGRASLRETALVDKIDHKYCVSANKPYQNNHTVASPD